MASMEMVRRYLDHITAGEFEAAMDYWADDVVVQCVWQQHHQRHLHG